MKTTEEIADVTGNLIKEIQMLKNEVENKQRELAKIMAKNFLKKFKTELPKGASFFLKLKIKEDEISEFLKDNNNLNCLEYLILSGILNKDAPKPAFHEFSIEIPDKHRIKKIPQKEIDEIVSGINNATHGLLVIGIYGKLLYSSQLRLEGNNLLIKGCYKFK